VRCTISGTVSTAVQRGLALRPVALFLVLFLWRLYGACERLKMEKNERHKSLAMAQVAELDPSLPLCLCLLMLQAQPLQLKSLRLLSRSLIRATMQLHPTVHQRALDCTPYSQTPQVSLSKYRRQLPNTFSIIFTIVHYLLIL
jgi:hypothetical protein